MRFFLPVLTLFLGVAALHAQEAPAAATASPPSAASPQPLPNVKPETDGRVWGALIYATNDPSQLTGTREKPATGLPNLYERLGKVFSFKHFEILGQHHQDIFREYESWVVPSRDLFMKIDSKGRPTRVAASNSTCKSGASNRFSSKATPSSAPTAPSSSVAPPGKTAASSSSSPSRKSSPPTRHTGSWLKKRAQLSQPQLVGALRCMRQQLEGA